MKRKEKVPLKGSELDAFTGWRHLLCSMYNHGRKQWKRQYNKRVRKLAKESLKHERDS